MTTNRSRGAEVWSRLTSLVFDNREAWRDEVVRMTGMPFSRYRALRLCQDSVTATQLASSLGVDAARTSLIVTDLARHGLVERTPDPQDGRRKIITISEAGRAMLQQVRERSSAAQLFEVLDDEELHTLSTLLDKVMGTAQ